jgi:hypothetical protein
MLTAASRIRCLPHPPYFSVSPTEDTTEVIEAESQAVLNTLTEHDFQDAFKKRQKRWERCSGRAIVATVDPKLVFDQMVAPVPEIIDGPLYTISFLSRKHG